MSIIWLMSLATVVEFRKFVEVRLLEIITALMVISLSSGGLGIYLLIGGTTVAEEQFSVFEMSDNSELNSNASNVEVDECQIHVDVSGSVKDPKVFCLQSGSILNDAIILAGGFTERFCSRFVEKDLNLAKELLDGDKIYIPSDSDPECSEVLESPLDLKALDPSCVNVNVDTKDQLETISGIGPSMADKIINGRPYLQIEDLLDVEGIGPVTLDKIKDKICL